MAELQKVVLLLTELLQDAPSIPEQTLQALISTISEFSFDAENGITFEEWYSRYTDLFESDAQNLDNSAKVRLLLSKLDTTSHARYVNYILPKLPKDVNFAGTLKILSQMFGTHTSICNKRYQCLQLVKSETEDIITYGAKVNRACENFDLKDMSIDQFKCLVFVSGLKGHAYADIRARLISQLDGETAEAHVTLHNLIREYQRLVNLNADALMIDRQPCSKQEKGNSHQQHSSKTEGNLPRTPCWQCGRMHFVRHCPFSEHQCKQCNRIGHKEGYCGCVTKRQTVPARGQKKPLNQPANRQNKPREK